MSADNSIIVLTTTRRWFRADEYTRQYGTSTPVYRVAHVLAWDNFEYYKENAPFLVGSYLDLVFKDSPVFEELSEAVKYAQRLEEEIGYVEYGTIFVDFREFSFLDDF